MLVKSRADCRFAPSQWEKVSLCNDVSHWLGSSLESTLKEGPQEFCASFTLCYVLVLRNLSTPVRVTSLAFGQSFRVALMQPWRKWVNISLESMKYCSITETKQIPRATLYRFSLVNTLRPRQQDCHFSDDIFKRIFLNWNCCIWIQISLTFVPNGPVNNKSALVQVMAWDRAGDKPVSGSMLAQFTDGCMRHSVTMI